MRVLTMCCLLLLGTICRGQDITQLVIAIPQGSETNGWLKPESYALTHALLDTLYSGRVSSDEIMQVCFVDNYRDPVTGERYHVFIDSLKNILGERYDAGMTPVYVQQMAGAVTDPTCRWTMTERPAIFVGSAEELGRWGIEPFDPEP